MTTGATSVEDWLVERTGVSVPTARTYVAHVGERLFDLPHLASGLSSGALSLDKVQRGGRCRHAGERP